MTKSISLTAILVRDHKTGGYTSFFAQFPNIIAEGDNEEQAEENLFRLVKTVFEHQKKEELSCATTMSDKDSIKTRSFDFASI